jgi:hypothetical protein
LPVCVTFEQAILAVGQGHHKGIAPDECPESNPDSMFTGREGKGDRLAVPDFLNLGAIEFDSEWL